MTFVFADTETGGLDCYANPICELALLATDEKFKEVARFSTFIKPYENLVLDERAMKVNKITPMDLKNGMTIKDVVDNVVSFCKKLNPSGKGVSKPILVGHNIPFDISFLNVAFRLQQKELSEIFYGSNDVINFIDTMNLSKMKWGGSMKGDDVQSMKLGVCCKRASIELIDAHGAMPDVIATMKLMKYIYSSNVIQDATTKQVVETEQKEDKSRNYFEF